MRFNHFKIVCAFQIDPSIVLTSGPYIKGLQEKLGGKLLMINTPEDAPPSLPRIVLKLKDTILNIALDRFQITTKPPSHVSENIDKALQFVYQRSSPIISDMQPAKLNYEWSGVVADVEYPEDPLVSNSGSEAALPLFDRLIKIDRKERELRSFQLRFGIRDNDFYINYTIDTYEKRKIKLDLPKLTNKHSININQFPLIECGLKVILDVNNKPMAKYKDPENSLKLILKKQSELIVTISKDLNLEDILK